MGAHICKPRTGNPTALPQGNALLIRNKVSIFKEVRLPFCAPRLILGQIYVAQHFCEPGAKRASAADGAKLGLRFRTFGTRLHWLAGRAYLKHVLPNSDARALTCFNSVNRITKRLVPPFAAPRL